MEVGLGDGGCMGRTADFVFFPIFVEEAPDIALRHAFYLGKVVESWELVFIGDCGAARYSLSHSRETILSGLEYFCHVVWYLTWV